MSSRSRENRIIRPPNIPLPKGGKKIESNPSPSTPPYLPSTITFVEEGGNIDRANRMREINKKAGF